MPKATCESRPSSSDGDTGPALQQNCGGRPQLEQVGVAGVTIEDKSLSLERPTRFPGARAAAAGRRRRVSVGKIKAGKISRDRPHFVGWSRARRVAHIAAVGLVEGHHHARRSYPPSHRALLSDAILIPPPVSSPARIFAFLERVEDRAPRGAGVRRSTCAHPTEEFRASACVSVLILSWPTRARAFPSLPFLLPCWRKSARPSRFRRRRTSAAAPTVFRLS